MASSTSAIEATWCLTRLELKVGMMACVGSGSNLSGAARYLSTKIPRDSAGRATFAHHPPGAGPQFP
ncbi:MAG TPA: hypothetical protein VGP93_02415, partial [Polyangiaceae bacterium]|nr:hypothetical protein [Polyangiaceae bacterium]